MKAGSQTLIVEEDGNMTVNVDNWPTAGQPPTNEEELSSVLAESFSSFSSRHHHHGTTTLTNHNKLNTLRWAGRTKDPNPNNPRSRSGE